MDNEPNNELYRGSENNAPIDPTANPMKLEAARTSDPQLEAEMEHQAPAADGQKPLVAPDTAEDPSRVNPASAPASGFAGFPKTKYHPVYGARTVNDPNEEGALPAPARNWFDTAEEADAHRTEREAQQVIHNNHAVKVNAALAGEDHDPNSPEVRGEAGVVRNSVSATESMKNGVAEPL